MSEPNKQKSGLQHQDWSGDMGEKWNHYLDQFEGMIAPIGEATLEHTGLKPGERVIDIGCGGGPTTLDIARRVAPHGSVLGLDISPVLVNTANARAEAAGLENVNFRCGDASTFKLDEPAYDVLFSRFGVMFFTDSIAAFRNLHGMLKPGARLVFCCWGPPPENPWVARLSEIVGRHVSMPAPDPTAPGPFAFADKERTTGILEQAGFTNVSFTPWRGPQLLGGPGMNPESAAEFSMKAFFVGEALVDQPESVKQAVIAEVKTLFAQHQTDKGIELQAMAWLVSAKA